MTSSLVYASYPVASAVIVLFGLAACIYQYVREKRQGGPDTPEFFLTARNSVPTFTIAWSFYAGAMGSWALFGPPSYAYSAGILGIALYAVSSGFPIMVIAFFGGVIQRRVPHILSFADYINRRFGRIVSWYVAALLLFNMGVALTAEFTAVGDLFQYVVGATRVPVVVLIGAVATIYTAWGGLYVSIITDQWQALASVIVVTIIFIYVWATFDAPLGPVPHYLGLSNYNGLASIAVMPISLVSSTIFSEAMWQRCWAGKDNRSLQLGALFGTLAVIVVVFLFAFGGFLALWGNVWQPSGPDDYGNLLLFSLLKARWVLVLVSVLSVTMSESAIDSLQNAIVDTISAAFVAPFFPRLSLFWIRCLVLVLNVPPIVCSLQGYNILQLFLLANLITTTSTIPVLLGLLPGRAAQKVVTPFSVVAGCLTGLAAVFVWALRRPAGVSYSSSLHSAFLVAYDYPQFLLAAAFSVIGLLVGAALEWAARAAVPALREYPYYDLSAPSDFANALAAGPAAGKGDGAALDG